MPASLTSPAERNQPPVQPKKPRAKSKFLVLKEDAPGKFSCMFTASSIKAARDATRKDGADGEYDIVCLREQITVKTEMSKIVTVTK